MRPDLPTGTVTFVFTDIAGSTKLLHELGDQRYADALAEQAIMQLGAMELLKMPIRRHELVARAARVMGG